MRLTSVRQFNRPINVPARIPTHPSIRSATFHSSTLQTLLAHRNDVVTPTTLLKVQARIRRVHPIAIQSLLQNSTDLHRQISFGSHLTIVTICTAQDRVLRQLLLAMPISPLSYHRSLNAQHS